MVEITSEEKTKLFEKLTKELRDFMESENTGAFLLYLGGKYKLSDDKVSLLSKLVGDVILGITPVTSLVQEINLKITTDPQIAMNLSQELYADLLAPIMSKTPAPPQASVGAPAPQMLSLPPATKIPAPRVEAPTQIERNTRIDRYRESINGTPGIVDLRKTQLPVRPAPIPVPLTPTIPKPMPPLTFTKPVEPAKSIPPTPLIEAEPHKEPPIINKIEPPKTSEEKPQFIFRPPGLPPTDIPKNILDLRKDKGEF